MDLHLFDDASPGALIPIRGSSPSHGDWEHRAFLPHPLTDAMPDLSPKTFMTVSNARAAIAALDNTARQLPNPQLLRQPTLRREAQSTSALEGTYAPIAQVITADEDEVDSAEMREIMNYVVMANSGYRWISLGRPLSAFLVSELQGALMSGTPLQEESGRLRQSQVVIGRRDGVPQSTIPIKAARFIPVPPGDQLSAGVDQLMEWKSRDHSQHIDPVVKAAMGHYQFETLHPYRDGNGRLGRYLITLDLLTSGILSEPTLTVSPWFEDRRGEYYQRLLGVSTAGDWDAFVDFFAHGIEQAAASTQQQMLRLTTVQESLKEIVRASSTRSERAVNLVDVATAHPTFTVKEAAAELGMSDPGTRRVIEQLIDLKVLSVFNHGATYRRKYFAPWVIEVLIDDER